MFLLVSYRTFYLEASSIFRASEAKLLGYRTERKAQVREQTYQALFSPPLLLLVRILRQVRLLNHLPYGQLISSATIEFERIKWVC